MEQTHPITQEVLWRDLTPLMRPKTIAVIGASQGRSRGNRIIENLLHLDFPGQIFPVNPRYSEVLGLRCYPELSKLPEPLDCVVVAVPARQVPNLLKSACDIGVRSAVVLSSGFAEVGDDGKERQNQLEAFSMERNLLICGPNCYGVFNVLENAPVFSSPILPGFLSGEVALLSQSGGLSTTIANALVYNRAVGFSYVVSCGNQAGVTIEEYLNYFVEDDQTRVVAAFVEGFKQPEMLLTVAAKAVSKNKPLIVLKVGKSEASRRAALTHSGSLAGAAEVVEAAFRQSGIVQVHSINELIDTISVFSCSAFISRFKGGRRIGVLSGSGGECGLVADVIERVGIQIPDLSNKTKVHLQGVLPDFGTPHNPLDGTGAMFEDDTIFPRLLEALIEEPGLDMIAVNINANDPRPKNVRSGDRFATKIPRIAARSTKPVAVYSSVVGGPVPTEIVQALRVSGVPLMEGADFAMTALRNVSDYHEFCKSQSAVKEDQHALTCKPLPQFSSGILPTEAAFRLLESFGIPMVPSVLTFNCEEAVAAATRMGFPVALKIESPAIPHKSDVGGVVLGLTTPADVRAAFVQIQDQAKIHAPTAAISGVLVQRMASGGVEIILGMKRDELFGPIIVCGLGGIFVELLKDIAIGIPPVSRGQARDLIRRLKGWPILAGMRGRPPADLEALADAIVGISQLTLSLGENLLAIDVNPLVVYSEQQGAVAVDALIQLK